MLFSIHLPSNIIICFFLKTVLVLENNCLLDSLKLFTVGVRENSDFKGSNLACRVTKRLNVSFSSMS